jgi:uncharacterized protein with PQ loop repeat
LNEVRNYLPKKVNKSLSETIRNSIFIVSIVMPLMTLPQVWKIFALQTAAGLSLFTWSAYIVFAFFWLGYRVLIKDRLLILTNTLWILMQASVVVGIVIYG